MGRVSTPLIGLLVATVVLFALWTIALKPSSSGSGSSATTSAPALNRAVASAHAAVSTANAASARAGGDGGSGAASPATTSPAGGSAAAPTMHWATPRPARPSPVSPRVTATASGRQLSVNAALEAGRVVVLLFYNPAGADDQAVRSELAAVPTARGQVFKLAVPITELTRYAVVTSRVAVNESPTLVIIDRAHDAATLAGFADRFEIAQRVQDALSTG